MEPTAVPDEFDVPDGLNEISQEINLHLVWGGNEEKLLESYKALSAAGEQMEQVHDEAEIDQLKNIFKRYAVFDARMKTRLLNVFHIAFADKDVYLMQVELDFGTKLSFKYGPKKRYVEYQAWAYARSRFPLGRAYVRALTSTDKWVGLFMPVRVRFPESPLFNKRFYLHADHVPAIKQHFNTEFVDMLGRAADLAMVVHGQDIIIGIPKVIAGMHMLRLLEIMRAGNFLGPAKPVSP